MKRFLLVSASVLALAACNATSGGGTASSESSAKPAKQMAAPQKQVAAPMVQEKSVEMTFIDISGFDEDLSAGLADKNREVVVDFPGKLVLSDMPARLDQWLAKVKESGGKVQAKEIPKKGTMATRGILGMLIDVGVKAQKAYAAEERLKPATNYNVLLEYDKETGQVARAVFYHR